MCSKQGWKAIGRFRRGEYRSRRRCAPGCLLDRPYEPPGTSGGQLAVVRPPKTPESMEPSLKAVPHSGEHRGWIRVGRARAAHSASPVHLLEMRLLPPETGTVRLVMPKHRQLRRSTSVPNLRPGRARQRTSSTPKLGSPAPLRLHSAACTCGACSLLQAFRSGDTERRRRSAGCRNQHMG